MSDLLIIKSNYVIKPERYIELLESFINQKAIGVILLPPGFEAIVVPDNVEIKLEGAGGNNA